MKKFLFALVCCMTVSLLAACGGSNAVGGGGQNASVSEEKVYLEESQVNDLFSHPNDFKGQYVKLKGKVFTAPETADGITALQIWYDPVNAENSFLVYTSSDEKFSADDYVFIDGKIDGQFKGENLMGGTLTVPLITDAIVEKSSYIDVVAPSVKTVEPAVEEEQHDFIMRVDKVEYAEKETRVYVTLTNNGSDSVSAGVYSTRIVQDGKQISPDTSSMSAYEGDYPELDYDIQPGASSSGIIVYPVIDQEKGFTFVLPDIYSDNWEMEFDDFSVEISAE